MSTATPRLGVTILGSGSRGNALVVHGQDEAILVDAGFSARELRRRMQEAGLEPRELAAVVVSHEHTDHARGLTTLVRQLEIPVYCNRRTAEVLRHRDKYAGPMRIFAAGSEFRIGSFRFEPFSIPHDANDPVGFVILWGNRRIGLATDLGHASQLVSYQLRECDLLVVESNHDIGMLRNSRRPWALKQRILGRHGHLSNEASVELIKSIVHPRTRHLVLAHASQECNRYDLVERQVGKCLAELGRDDVALAVARQDTFLPTLWV